MAAILSIRDLQKTYEGGFQALKGISLDIEEGELLALLGPNGAGKTTLISAVCGLITPTGGQVSVAGHDIQRDFRAARRLIGLVPQEVALEPFETVWNTTRLSRGLFGCGRDDAKIEEILRALSLWDKKDAQVRALSGGMKRRVLIAKALSHEPRVLFLDEPTAGVDVELRKGMWDLVERLKAGGVTVILTTHYIEEAEALADRVGVIDKGHLLLVEDKAALMARMGEKQIALHLAAPLQEIPAPLAKYRLQLGTDRQSVVYTYDTKGERTGITSLLNDIAGAGLTLRDVQTRESSLEEIFVGLVGQKGNAA